MAATSGAVFALPWRSPGQPSRWQTPALVPCSAVTACMLLVETIHPGFTQSQASTCERQSVVVSARAGHLLEESTLGVARVRPL